jgi:superfamily II DNA or RNA helicase
MINDKNDPDQLVFGWPNELEQLKRQLQQVTEELVQLKRQNVLLIQENNLLKKRVLQPYDSENVQLSVSRNALDLFEQTPAAPQPSQMTTVTKHSPIEEKVRFYRSLFRGRDDVYAVRGTDKQGKSTYYRKRDLLGKENGKYIWGDDLPLTDEIIRRHMEDEQNPVTIGLYPMLMDEACWFLAIDFDKATWKEDTAAFLETCRSFAVPAALERSRSGNGGHIWIFFEEPVAARTARLMGSALLTATLEKRNQFGLDSYDRMFPNQDTLPRDKKLGNLIALPLQRAAGKLGNSLFIDSDYSPYPDQWIYLSSLLKMSNKEVEAVVGEARRIGSIIRIANLIMEDDESETDIPWIAPSSSGKMETPVILPPVIRMVYSQMLFIEKELLSSAQLNLFIRLGAFQNPGFYRAQKMRLSTWGIPRIINCTEDHPKHLALPRGCLEGVKRLCADAGVALELQDERQAGFPIAVHFRGELRERQLQAAQELAKADIGVLSATTAFGKTIVGLWMIASRQTNTLILVHTTQLLEQWKARITQFLDLSDKQVGQIGGGKHKRTGIVDVAMIQTMLGKGNVKDYIAEYGHIVVDECHHVSAFSFEQVLKASKAKYVLGLTATLTRKDGHHPIVLMQCGPVRFRADAKKEAAERPFQHVVIQRLTSFRMVKGDAPVIHEIYDRLIQDEKRNEQIFDDLLLALEEGRSPILLTDRTAHLAYFEARLQGFAKNIIVLKGGMGKKQLRIVQDQMERIPANEERVLLATGRFAGEGFDDARLDTLFLAMPFSWKGTLHQYAGRLHRQYDGKKEVRIYDYVDDQVPLLKRMYNKRSGGYRALGYELRN